MKFWKQQWWGKDTLEQSYHRLFTISEQQDAYISKLVDAQNTEAWNLRFRRPLYSWEEVQLENLKELLSGVQIQSKIG